MSLFDKIAQKAEALVTPKPKSKVRLIAWPSRWHRSGYETVERFADGHFRIDESPERPTGDDVRLEQEDRDAWEAAKREWALDMEKAGFKPSERGNSLLEGQNFNPIGNEHAKLPRIASRVPRINDSRPPLR